MHSAAPQDTTFPARPRAATPARLLRSLLLLWLCAGPALSLAATDAEPDYQQALALARDGQHAAALHLLAALVQAHPGTPIYRYDYITVLGWAGHHAEALAQAGALDLAVAPAYVLESLGHAARHSGDAPQAERYYRLALGRDPQRTGSHIGLARSLDDQARSAEAITLLNTQLSTQVPTQQAEQPDNILALETLLPIQQRANLIYDALATCDRILALQPGHREAARQRILLTAQLDAAPLALGMATQNPGLLDADEIDTLNIDAAGSYLRWNDLYQPDASRRHEDTAQAISLLQGVIDRRQARADARPDITRRARGDLVLALQAAGQPQRALDEYAVLQAGGAAIPDYVSRAAADAWQASGQPQRAHALYSELRSRQPDDFALGMALFFNLMEQNRQEEAYDLIDRLAAEPADAERRLQAQDNAALARAWSGNLADAQTRYEDLLASAPNNPQLHTRLGYVYLWRGWPRRAGDQFAAALAIEPAIGSARAGQIEALLERNDVSGAAAGLADLQTDMPTAADVERLAQRRAIDQLRELRMQASISRASDAQYSSSDLALDTRLYSRPQHEHYRIFAQDYLARSSFPEGVATFHRYGSGVEYRARDLELSGAVSVQGGGDSLPGLAVQARRQLDDHWRIGIGAESRSNDIPLRGWLAEDLHGWSLAADAQYRWHESRSLSLGVQQLQFSDDNTRSILSAAADQRLINRPRYKLDGRLALYTSRNTRDDAPYYNPQSDASLGATFTSEWLLSPGYTNGFLQRLAISLGSYRQQGFDTRPTGGLDYEHEWRLQQRLTLVYGLAINRAVYNQEYETQWRLHGGLGWRF